MKPRTKLQHEVMELTQHLFKISKAEEEWAKRECLEHKGFATKNRVICMDCGETFSPELVKRKRAVCPHCDTKLKIEQTKKRTDKQQVYFATAEVYREFQVIRNYELIASYKAGERAHIYCHEIQQDWISPNGKRTIVARLHTLNYYCDCWNGEMKIRKDYCRYYYKTDKYNVSPIKYYPDSEFKDEYSKYGIDSNLQGLTFIEAIEYLPKYPQAETLLKARQYALLGLFDGGDKYKIESRWASVKICIRNKYTVKDARMWIDYIDLLSYFGKDLHNAHYVCPKNLKKEHDELVAKKRKQQEKEALQRKREEAQKNEKEYKSFIQRFADLTISDGQIEIRPLQSVEEFIEEGDTLHHCVFTNNYFLRKNSLILSAKKDGERLETIELSLENLKVKQCHGKFNKSTEHHDAIIRLVERNKKKIKKCIAV